MNIKRLRFETATVIPPKSQEFTLSLKWYGSDTGVFPASTANTALTVKANSIRFQGNEETRDFKAGMDPVSLMRVTGQNSSIAISANLLHPSHILRKYTAEGPLCEVTVTSENATDSSNDQIMVFKGIMKLPDIDFISNPGIVELVIESYGSQPVLTIPSTPT